MLTRSQEKVVKILLLTEIPKPKKKKPDEEPNITDMSELEESDESAAQKEQSAKGLKILTPNQMLSRLPIALAQLNVGNNSKKLKNEIRRLLYSLYRSQKLTKTIYNNLINII